MRARTHNKRLTNGRGSGIVDHMSTSYLIATEAHDIDLLGTYETALVTSDKLREGMVLVDTDLGTPCAILDHRNGTRAGGAVEWLVEDLDNGGWRPVTFNTTRTPSIPVAVA